MMPNANLCELNLRIPFDLKTDAETILEVLKVDQDQHEKFVRQELNVEDNTLCCNITSARPKELRSGSTAFFEALLLVKEIIKEFAAPNNPTEL